MDLKLSGKRVLVTGGNSGLGAAIGRAFAAEHARVAINYLVHPEQTEQLAAQLRALGSDVLALKADVSQADAVAAMFGQIDTAWGGLDVLVNNAASTARGRCPGRRTRRSGTRYCRSISPARFCARARRSSAWCRNARA